MLSVNLCAQYGLFNRAIGIVRDIIFSVNTEPPGLPGVLIVEMV